MSVGDIDGIVRFDYDSVEASRQTEIDVINGAVPRHAARVGVEAPVNATLTAVVKAVERQWGEQTQNRPIPSLPGWL